MSEYGILKWSLVVAALLAIFTKAPRVMEGDGGPSLLEQRDPYGYGGRFAGQPVDVWLTIEATNRKTGEPFRAWIQSGCHAVERPMKGKKCVLRETWPSLFPIPRTCQLTQVAFKRFSFRRRKSVTPCGSMPIPMDTTCRSIGLRQQCMSLSVKKMETACSSRPK